jgi:hypothetical protein
VGVPAHLAEVSSYANAPVDEKWFTAAPKGRLAARLRLPLGASMDVDSDPAYLAEMCVEGSTQHVWLSGFATLTVKVDPPLQDLRICGQVLTPTSSWEIAFDILHAPREELNGVKHAHKHGDEAKHLQGYYGLLKGHGGGQHGPRITMCQDRSGDTSPPKDLACPSERVTAPPSRPVFEYIDPYNCSVGFGE